MQLKKKIGIAVLILLCSGLVGYPVFAEENQINKDSSDEVVITGTMDIESSDEADKTGLNDWCSSLLKRNESAKHVVYGFVFSDEFIKSNMSRKTYITKLYEGILDREPDSDGLNDWLSAMEKKRHHWRFFVVL